MLFPRGHEVYVLLEDVFELDHDVDADNDCAVRIRTRSGLRISLPIEYVAGWDVHTPVRDVLAAGDLRQDPMAAASTSTVMASLGAGPAGSAAQSPPVVEADLAELVERVRDLAGDRPRTMLGLAGAPGSGKSTIAEALATALVDLGAVVVPFDGFHLANSTLAAQGKLHRKGALDTFDTAGYAALLERLRDPRPTVYAPSYQRSFEEAIAGSITVESACRLIITEGNYLLVDQPDLRAARNVLTQVWYIDLDDQTRLDRLVSRHVTHGKTADDAHDWALGTDQVNAELVASSRDAADLCIRLK